jgi:hypothetical protein
MRSPCFLVLAAMASMTVGDAAFAAPTSIDEAFRELERRLPEPATLSEGNGASTLCLHGNGATYTLLAAIAKNLPLTSDTQLPQLVMWARHPDVCIREIALEAMIPRIGFDRNKLVLPSMDDPEHYIFHDILATLASYLDAKHIAYDRRLFAGLKLAPAVHDFHANLEGHWVEDAPGKGVIDVVDITRDEVRVTQHFIPADRNFPDDTETTKIKDVTLDRGQFFVTGVYSVETNTAVFHGQPVTPAQFEYHFWQVSDDIVWFKDATSYWNKLRRK